MPKVYYCQESAFGDFVNELRSNFRVLSPLKKENPLQKEDDYSCRQIQGRHIFVFNPYRVIEPLKSFLTAPREEASEYFNSPRDPAGHPGPTVIIGVKNCGLTSLKVQDFVFLEGAEVDSLYSLRRQNTILISSDCTAYRKACFCLALEILPYPASGFDINLSPLTDGYLLETGSRRGEELIEKNRGYFIPARETQLEARRMKREKFIEGFKKSLLAQNIPSRDSLQRLVRDGYNLETWQDFMLTCVECGGCNLICDTCHCFLLSDNKSARTNIRLRSWDSCQYENFGRVAGGANPLRTRTKRLRNRFMKKFDFFVDNLGMPACCGCGRCIEVCPGKIDIREVLKDLKNRLALSKA